MYNNIVNIETYTLEQLISNAVSIKNRIDELNKNISALKADLSRVDDKIMEQMDSAGIQRTGTSSANVTITESVVPTPEDWEAFNKFVKANDAFHLYQRRISTTAYREHLAAGEEIPGLTPFTKRSLRISRT